MQTVKLLPDTPPPPAPKPEEKRPEPPKEAKATAQLQPPKPAEVPPQPQALKSDEAAGDGPGGGLVAGAVSRDYTDQKIGSNTIGGQGGDSGVSLAAAQAYAQALTRSLNDFLARDRELRRADYRARVLVWLSPQGTLQRVEIVEGSGDAPTDQTLRAAIGRFPGAATPPPERLPQPLRLQVTNRMIG